MYKTEREYFELIKSRPDLSDDEFISRYYGKDVDRELPLRIRQILKEQLKLDRIVPTDNPCDILQDIDLLEIVREIAEEFDVTVDKKELDSVDGSFDSIVRLFDAKLKSRQS